MKKIIILNLLLIGMCEATEYQLTHLKKGGTLNVREVPVVNSKTVVGKIPYDGTDIRIKQCKFNKSGQEWCYITYPVGGYHLEGWINRYYLKEMKDNSTSKTHITNFLSNFYMADEENFLDKLQVFYAFPMQQYYRTKDVSLMQLRSKKVDYYKKWSKRTYHLTHMKILKRRDKYIDVQTTVRWSIEARDGFNQAGKDIQKLRLLPENNTFKVLALKNLKHTIFPQPKPTLEVNNSIENVALTDSKNTTALANKKYYIKAGSFYGIINPVYLSKISSNGFGYIVQKAAQNGNVIRRVYIGPFERSEEAAQALSKVREKINANAYLQSLHN